MAPKPQNNEDIIKEIVIQSVIKWNNDARGVDQGDDFARRSLLGKLRGTGPISVKDMDEYDQTILKPAMVGELNTSPTTASWVDSVLSHYKDALSAIPIPGASVMAQIAPKTKKELVRDLAIGGKAANIASFGLVPKAGGAIGAAMGYGFGNTEKALNDVLDRPLEGDVSGQALAMGIGLIAGLRTPAAIPAFIGFLGEAKVAPTIIKNTASGMMNLGKKLDTLANGSNAISKAGWAGWYSAKQGAKAAAVGGAESALGGDWGQGIDKIVGNFLAGGAVSGTLGAATGLVKGLARNLKSKDLDNPAILGRLIEEGKQVPSDVLVKAAFRDIAKQNGLPADTNVDGFIDYINLMKPKDMPFGTALNLMSQGSAIAKQGGLAGVTEELAQQASTTRGLIEAASGYDSAAVAEGIAQKGRAAGNALDSFVEQGQAIRGDQGPGQYVANTLQSVKQFVRGVFHNTVELPLNNYKSQGSGMETRANIVKGTIDSLIKENGNKDINGPEFDRVKGILSQIIGGGEQRLAQVTNKTANGRTSIESADTIQEVPSVFANIPRDISSRGWMDEAKKIISSINPTNPNAERLIERRLAGRSLGLPNPKEAKTQLASTELSKAVEEPRINVTDIATVNSNNISPNIPEEQLSLGAVASLRDAIRGAMGKEAPEAMKGVLNSLSEHVKNEFGDKAHKAYTDTIDVWTNKFADIAHHPLVAEAPGAPGQASEFAKIGGESKFQDIVASDPERVASSLDSMQKILADVPGSESLLPKIEEAKKVAISSIVQDQTGLRGVTGADRGSNVGDRINAFANTIDPRLLDENSRRAVTDLTNAQLAGTPPNAQRFSLAQDIRNKEIEASAEGIGARGAVATIGSVVPGTGKAVHPFYLWNLRDSFKNQAGASQFQQAVKEEVGNALMSISPEEQLVRALSGQPGARISNGANMSALDNAGLPGRIATQLTRQPVSLEPSISTTLPDGTQAGIKNLGDGRAEILAWDGSKWVSQGIYNMGATGGQ